MNFGVVLLLVSCGAILVIGIVVSVIRLWWQQVDPRDDGRWLPRERVEQRGFEVKLPDDRTK